MSDYEVSRYDIDHHVQVGFLAIVTLLWQIRDGDNTLFPSPDYVEKSAEFLRKISEFVR